MLFVVHKLNPHRTSTGQPQFFLCDVAFSKFLGANFERQLHTMFLQEILAKNEHLLNAVSEISFYRTTKGSLVHFIVESQQNSFAIKLLFAEKIDLRELEVLKALPLKLENTKIQSAAMSPIKESVTIGNVKILPWESIC